MFSRDEARKVAARAMGGEDADLVIIGEGQTEREWVFRTGFQTDEEIDVSFPIYTVSKRTGRTRSVHMPSAEAFDLEAEEDAYEAAHR